MPGLTHAQHPRNFAWFPSNASLSSVLGDIVAAGIGALGITWQSAPALTELEQVACDWARQLCGLSGKWKGTIYDGASTASLVALLVARESARVILNEPAVCRLKSTLWSLIARLQRTRL